jgi:hypothetical protein
VEELKLPPANTASWTFAEAAVHPADSSIYGEVEVERLNGDVVISCGGQTLRVFGSQAEKIGLAIVAAARGAA